MLSRSARSGVPVVVVPPPAVKAVGVPAGGRNTPPLRWISYRQPVMSSTTPKPVLLCWMLT